MELLIRYTDGTTESVYTDPSWKGVGDSPVVFAEIYVMVRFYGMQPLRFRINQRQKPQKATGSRFSLYFDTQVMRAQYAAKVR